MTTTTAPLILIVEDQCIIAAEVARKLKRLGYAVAGPVASGAAAVAAVARQAPALVLLDINLEGAMDGFAAAAAIRQTSQVPLIMVSGSIDAVTLAQVRQWEPCSALSKPFDLDELKDQIELALRRPPV